MTDSRIDNRIRSGVSAPSGAAFRASTAGISAGDRSAHPGESIATDIAGSSDQSLVERINHDIPNLTKAGRCIAEHLIAKPTAFVHSSVQDIAKATKASEATVVRFCRRYGFSGIPDFRIALAQALAEPDFVSGRVIVEPKVSDKSLVNRRQKSAIARYAARFVENDRAVILDSGSTTELFAHELRSASGLVVMTTGLNVINSLALAPQHTLMVPGGTVRFESMSITGRMVESALATMNFDTAYLGADAIDPDRGLSTFREEEAHLNTAMAKASRRVVVLADSSKFRAPALHRFLDIESVHVIVTDSDLDDAVVRRIEACGVTIHRVKIDEV